MDIRISPDDLASARRIGADASLSAVIRTLERLPNYPWRACWVRVHMGLALFHFHRAGDPQGQFRRVPVGLLTLNNTEAAKTMTIANAIVKRAAASNLIATRLPAEALALKSPLGFASFAQAAA